MTEYNSLKSNNGILVTGGTGFIGSSLIPVLLDNILDVEVYVLTHTPKKISQFKKKFAELTSAIHRIHFITSIDNIPDSMWIAAVINLAGAGIADFWWTQKRKQQLFDSRVRFTQTFGNALRQRSQKPPNLWIAASAVGYYGDQGENIVNEETNPNQCFSQQLVSEWEQATLDVTHGWCSQVVVLRFGIVLGKNGGLLKRLAPSFKLGMGSVMGNGKQWFPWIHEADIHKFCLSALHGQLPAGVYNAVAPDIVRQKEFANTLAHVLNRPRLLTIPNAALKLGFGEMSDLFLHSVRCTPQAAFDEKYEFIYPELESALINSIK